MDKVSGQNRQAQLQAIEVIKDFARKLTAQSKAYVAHSVSDGGCATLVVHVSGPEVEESESLSQCTGQLKRVAAELEAIHPKPKAAKKPRVKSEAESQVAEAKAEEPVADEPVASSE